MSIMVDDLLDNESEDLFLAGSGEGQLALSLVDLLPDADGNVVLFNDAGVTEMAIVTENAVVNSGIANDQAHVENGDVAGMAYYSFDSGTTLYFPVDVHVSVIPETG
jgi:hypothetical protein